MATQSIRIGNPYNNYTDAFDVDQDPLTSGGRWLNNTNANLTRFRTSGGRAIAKAIGAGEYDDSAALMEGFGPDVEMTATVFKDPSINASATHECEFLMRASQSATLSFQYEVLFAHFGGCQIFRWADNGAGGQAFLNVTKLSGSENLGRAFVTGDRIRVRIQGSTITASVIDASNNVTVLAVYSDTTLTTGLCGIGGYFRTSEGANQAHFCFEDVYITEV